jgi:hypothetical protein
MLNIDKNGLYLYQKKSNKLLVLKDLIKLHKTIAKTGPLLFSYVEAKSSLHPELTLWENIKLATGNANWREFCQTLCPHINFLLKYISNAHQKASESSTLERFIVAFIQGYQEKETLLIDVDEDLLNLDFIQDLNRIFVNQEIKKKIYLATANPNLWSSLSDQIFYKDEKNQFQMMKLNPDKTKNSWAA